MTRTKSQKRRAKQAKQNRDLVVSRKRQIVTVVNAKPVKKRVKRRVTRMSVNPYLESLLYPEKCRGCKIPDGSVMTPTGTWQTFHTISLQANAAGVSGVWVSPRANNGLYQTVAADATPDAITWSTTNALLGQGTAFSLYQSARVVSASVEGIFTGNTSSDQGTFCGLQRYVFGNNQGVLATSNNPPVSVNGAINDPLSDCFPVRNGCRVLYRPMNLSEFEMAALSNPSYPGGSSFGIIAHGMTPQQNIMYHICVNWEGLPQQANVGLVGTSQPEPRTESWMASAANWASNLTGKVSSVFDSNMGNQFVQGAGQYVANRVLNNARQNLMNTPRLNNNNRLRIEL